MGPLWRADYGVRFDAFQIFSTQFARGFSQISPRLKISRVYGARADVYVYAGRFFTPFSFENVSPAAAQELNAPLQPTVAQFDLKPQRDTDIEVGGSMPLGPGQLGVRVMQKNAMDLIDDTQVGVTALHQDINYARGNISSQSADYQQALARGGRLYVSLTHTRSVNKGCETQLLAPCFGAPDDWTPADHDQRWDGAGGVSLPDGRGGWWSINGEYGSGLSSAYCQPATDECKVPPHTTFDFERGVALNDRLTLTLGMYDIFNDRYRITYLNAQGNHYAPGRTFRVGLRFGAR
jgi:outer membrane receptor protein involved in Fe transport